MTKLEILANTQIRHLERLSADQIKFRYPFLTESANYSSIIKEMIHEGIGNSQAYKDGRIMALETAREVLRYNVYGTYLTRPRPYVMPLTGQHYLQTITESLDTFYLYWLKKCSKEELYGKTVKYSTIKDIENYDIENYDIDEFVIAILVPFFCSRSFDDLHTICNSIFGDVINLSSTLLHPKEPNDNN